MAANNSIINNIYNYYLTTYAPKSVTQFDTHKKSELRGVYNSIVKLNKDDSLYIVDKSEATREYAVGLKENARSFRNTIASLGGLSDDELLNKKTAYSSNESIASASFIGENNPEAEVPSFELSVQKMASSQVNLGKSLPNGESMLGEDTYSFDVGINGLNYEFQYNIREDDTNLDVMNRISRLISNSGIGLKAEVVPGENDTSAIRIESVNTGSTGDGSLLFSITDNNTSKKAGSVDYFGLGNVVSESSDSEFTVNGMQRHASGNTFTVEKTYEVTITGVSADENDTATIDLKNDFESMTSNISSLIDGYNAFVDTADSYAESHPKANRLVREMGAIASLRKEELANIGIDVTDEGRLALNEETLSKAAFEGTLNDNFEALKTFTGQMLKKANDVSLNPMNYADRTVVAYKNPGHNFAAPYVASPYTGMMFNSYC